MAKYRKKPIEIEAFKWTGDINQTEDPIWIVEAIQKGDVWCYGDSKKGYTVMTIANNNSGMTANRGDYIIKGVNGEIYPCKPEIFEMTYEAVEEIKECGSENKQKLNKIFIRCDGKDIIINTIREVAEISRLLDWNRGLDILTLDNRTLEDEGFKNEVSIKPRAVTLIKYINDYINKENRIIIRV